MKISPFAGKPVQPDMLVNIPALVTAYYTSIPDPLVAKERVAFGTSGHRGNAFERSFNEGHILAISQAICLYRHEKKINGPLFIGMDTHALSFPALASALEVLAANGVVVMLSEKDEYTPTPVISHAIITYNKGRKTGLADGIVITPSHNPPTDGGFKYNPTNGGPAGSAEYQDVVAGGTVVAAAPGRVAWCMIAADAGGGGVPRNQPHTVEVHYVPCGAIVLWRRTVV